MSYKIAFLNPWRNAAENQGYQSLRMAAERLGCTLISCSNSMEIEDCDPDYVLAAASTQPKLTRHPTFGVIHEPRERFLLHREYLNNLLTYDGYFTIMETLHRFLRNVLTGVGRECPIGFYFNVPQRVEIHAPVETLAAQGRIKLTYFGTNWDNRQRELFMYLDQEGLIDVFGPQASWAYLTGRSYRGVLPFDGEAPQRAYAERGAGLVLLSDGHLRDDIISNRIFEIASVGALGVACDTPWLRRHFGDSLYYFDQRAPASRIAQRLREIVSEIHADPAAAAARAQEARRIFEQHFSAEVLLKNTIGYFEQWKRVHTPQDRSQHPSVGVIMRCGGRPVATVKRALQSLKEQTFGRVSAILVLWRDLDVNELQSMIGEALVEMRIVRRPGAGRSAALSAGLQAIDTPYFGILDDDDCWFPTHLERIFETFRRDPQARIVLSGNVRQGAEAFEIMGGGSERRRIDRFGPSGQPDNVWHLLSPFVPNAFICESALLDSRLTVDLEMTTAEDSALELGLIAKSRPRFNYAATAMEFDSEDGSRFLEDTRRNEDELTWFTTRISELDVLNGPDRTRHLLATTLLRALADKDSLVQRLGDRVIFGSHKIDYSAVSSAAPPKIPVPLSAEHVTLWGASRFFSETVAGSRSAQRLEVIPPKVPWNFGAEIDIGVRGLLTHEGMAIVRGRVTAGLIGFSLFDPAGREALFRRVLAIDGGVFELHVPLTKGSRIGRLVAHNWADGRACAAVLESLSVVWFGEGAPSADSGSQRKRLSRQLKRTLRRAVRAGVAWIRQD